MLNPYKMSVLNFNSSKVRRSNNQEISYNATSLEYVIEGLCNPEQLLDYIENFILFRNKDGIETKIIAQNHQFLGVNNAYERFLQRNEYNGKLGVFWHTQGSGKSFSMVFYARKISRKLTGNFCFVIITDRTDLNDQIHKNFVYTGTIGPKDEVKPNNAEQMRKYLSQNKKFIFTLIQKFRYDKNKKYPRLFDPEKETREIIVMVDEAHRTQYKDLAENMREGLKGAHFIAFTGTPLLGKERKTNKWFGDYVSEYNFQDAMADNATVPLFYEKRVPQMLIQNEDLNDEFYQLLEDENIDKAQQEKLERKYAKELEIIKRDDRLNTIARDIVYHFPRRGYLGKAMVISVDKFTAIKMYEKVQQQWKTEIKRLRGLINTTTNQIEKARFKKMVEYMKTVEMAVVISDPNTDKEKFEKQGLNIQPHLKRLEQIDEHGHDIEHNFKNEKHPLQIVFVCAIWLTGFDAETVSTLYLDKPMKGHTLMQTIARANRVTSYQIESYNGKLIEKKNGEIIDYYNVFRNMQEALKEYGQGQNNSEEMPVQEKTELFRLLNDAILETLNFCRDRHIDLESITEDNNTFKNIGKFNTFADILLSKDDWRKAFNVYDNTVSSLYEACKPEILEQEVQQRQKIAIIQYLRGIIDSLVEKVNIDDVSFSISELLDESVIVDEGEKFNQQEHQATYQVIQKGKIWDLSKIDFEQLKADFPAIQYKHIQIAEIRAFIEDKLQKMMQQNQTRINFTERLQTIIDRYNAGNSATENYFEDLVNFIQDLDTEDKRHIREGLTEDELELFDLLKKDKFTQTETQKVKLAAKDLIKRIKEAKPPVLVQDWWKDSRTKMGVQTAIEKVLDDNLPNSYDRVIFKEKCERIFDLIIDFAANGKKWVA
ncbi:HsdR family type I site-specific deoxyribonuclease [Crocosphaera sp. UHCC 0190]|uniref:type I restriction endonuclease subunit R n=1 Tax=Crocosphaera sp. UHCC 0190 TaxID=3110246 RepID=UPI002B20B799|nr:HsdR family type I site-specific deoxyribonuclease [Crocosphaera sp. UHCC 0190]MEA5508562.1 HsdR family type I site-specific deoxyribonuclease [Crocosphaera sp. UHCC 0190]